MSWSGTSAFRGPGSEDPGKDLVEDRLDFEVGLGIDETEEAEDWEAEDLAVKRVTLSLEGPRAEGCSGSLVERAWALLFDGGMVKDYLFKVLLILRDLSGVANCEYC